MRRGFVLCLLGLSWAAAQDLPPGLPPEMATPKAAAVPPPAVPPAAVVPVPPPAILVPVPSRIPVDHYQTLWQRSPFELSIQTANAAPTGIAADWLLTSLSRVDGQPVAILVNKTTSETAVVKTKSSGSHGMRLISAQIAQDYRQSKVKLVRGTEEAELIFQDQDLNSLQQLAPVTLGQNAGVPPGMPANANNPSGNTISRPPGSPNVQPGSNSPSATPKPPRRLIIRPKPVTPPTS